MVKCTLSQGGFTNPLLTQISYKPRKCDVNEQPCTLAGGSQTAFPALVSYLPMTFRGSKKPADLQMCQEEVTTCPVPHRSLVLEPRTGMYILWIVKEAG